MELICDKCDQVMTIKGQNGHECPNNKFNCDNRVFNDHIYIFLIVKVMIALST